ncbi:MAG: hypothetical protein AB1Z18_00635 [Desulfobacterales bacterium]
MRSYRAIIERYIREFGDGPVDQVTPEHVLTFLNRLTEGNKPYTKRIRFSQLSSFFNFVRNNIDPELRNPCGTPMIRKLYRHSIHCVIASTDLMRGSEYENDGVRYFQTWPCLSRYKA